MALGMPFRETVIKCLGEPRLVNRLQLECARMYGVDGVRVWMTAPAVEVVDDGENAWQIDPETGEKVGRVDFYGGGGIVPLEEKPTIRDEEDIEAQEVRSADELLKSEPFQSIEETVADGGNELCMIGAPGAVSFAQVTLMRGKEQAFLDIIERPEFAKRIIDKGVEIAIQNAVAYVKAGIDALYIGDTYGGVIGPRFFREFCVPSIRRFCEAMRGYGVPIYLHICGNSSSLFELMAESGVDCIEPLDPLGGVSIADAKRRVGHRVALMGGVNTVLLAHGTLDEVREDCRRCLTEGAPGGGYILAAGDMLPTETSKEKVEAMVAAAANCRYDGEAQAKP
jgi:uroporphyrinogen-III decarboxylase